MICIHHNKDLDGYSSGAIVRRKYPDCKLIGWDYGNPIPEIPEGEEVIMIDISFPMEEMDKLAEKARNVTWIDHHISAKKAWDEAMEKENFLFLGKINYVYQLGIAACEIGWMHFFRDEALPDSILLLGQYDTWRENGTDRWNNEILPFQFYMRTVCTDPESFPIDFFNNGWGPIQKAINTGKSILKYQEQQDMLACGRAGFEREVFGGLRGLCLNQGAFSSETMKTMYDESKHDILIGFQYNGRFWNVSLRSTTDAVNVSEIAKARGGGGHARAAGFEADTFENIFI